MRLIINCFVFLSFMLLATWCRAEDFSMNIKVDVEDKNSSTAQQRAMTEASRTAVIAAVKRISDDQGVEKINSMTDNQLVNFIKGTAISDEKASAQRYMANLHLTVNMDLLKEYLKERQFKVSQDIMPKVVLIPVFSEYANSFPMLWEPDNRWKMIWDKTNFTSNVDFIVIDDNYANISNLTAQQAQRLDTVKLNEIKKINRADDVYVIGASYNGIEGLDVNIRSLSGKHKNLQIDGLKATGDELFYKAIDEIVPLLETQVLEYKESFAKQEVKETTILFPFGNLGEWVAVENKIKSLPEITDLQLKAFSQQKAQFVIYYNGDIDDIAIKLRAHGYQLEDSGNYMTLNYIGD